MKTFFTHYPLFALLLSYQLPTFVYASPVFDIQEIKLSSPAQENIAFCKIDSEQARTLFLHFDATKGKTATLQFVFPTIPASDHERVLLLLHSRCSLDKPQIETPLSRQALTLDMSDMERLGIFEIPAMVTQPNTRLGSVSTANNQTTIDVHLELDKLNNELASGNTHFYIQAVLLDKEDYQQKRYSKALLSSPYTLYVGGSACPTSEEFTKLRNTENQLCANLRKFSATNK